MTIEIDVTKPIKAGDKLEIKVTPKKDVTLTSSYLILSSLAQRKDETPQNSFIFTIPQWRSESSQFLFIAKTKQGHDIKVDLEKYFPGLKLEGLKLDKTPPKLQILSAALNPSNTSLIDLKIDFRDEESGRKPDELFDITYNFYDFFASSTSLYPECQQTSCQGQIRRTGKGNLKNPTLYLEVEDLAGNKTRKSVKIEAEPLTMTNEAVLKDVSLVECSNTGMKVNFTISNPQNIQSTIGTVNFKQGLLSVPMKCDGGKCLLSFEFPKYFPEQFKEFRLGALDHHKGFTNYDFTNTEGLKECMRKVPVNKDFPFDKIQIINTGAGSGASRGASPPSDIIKKVKPVLQRQ